MMYGSNWIAVFVVTSSYPFSFKLNYHPITRSDTHTNGVCVCVLVWGGVFFCWKIKFMLKFYISLTVHLDVILVNDQLYALFFILFTSCLYMFRATSAHHQEDQIVSIHRLV
jgi:hypothetical protein